MSYCPCPTSKLPLPLSRITIGASHLEGPRDLGCALEKKEKEKKTRKKWAKEKKTRNEEVK